MSFLTTLSYVVLTQYHQKDTKNTWKSPHPRVSRPHDYPLTSLRPLSTLILNLLIVVFLDLPLRIDASNVSNVHTFFDSSTSWRWLWNTRAGVGATDSSVHSHRQLSLLPFPVVLTPHRFARISVSRPLAAWRTCSLLFRFFSLVLWFFFSVGGQLERDTGQTSIYQQGRRQAYERRQVMKMMRTWINT